MLTVFTGHPDCTTLRSEHRGWSSPADPATLIAVLPHSRATGPLYISAGLLPAAVVSLETFVPELRGQVLSSTLRFFSLAGSGYALRLPLLAQHNAGPRNLRCRSSLTGCRSPPPRSGGSTFSLLPQQPCRPLCPCGLFRSLRFYLPDIVRGFRQPHAVADTGQMPLPGLAVSFRCYTPPADWLRYVRPLHLTVKAFP
jgi:hypothetical protein